MTFFIYVPRGSGDIFLTPPLFAMSKGRFILFILMCSCWSFKRLYFINCFCLPLNVNCQLLLHVNGWIRADYDSGLHGVIWLLNVWRSNKNFVGVQSGEIIPPVECLERKERTLILTSGSMSCDDPLYLHSNALFTIYSGIL